MLFINLLGEASLSKKGLLPNAKLSRVNFLKASCAVVICPSMLKILSARGSEDDSSLDSGSSSGRK